MPPRVAFLTHYSELYGANLSLLNLIEGLSNFGFRAHVICPDSGDLLRVLTERQIPSALLPFEWWVSNHRTLRGSCKRIARNIRLLPAVVRQIAAWQIDLVYSNSSVFAVGALAAAALRLPHIWHVREFGNRDYGLWLDLGSNLSRCITRTADATIFVSHALKRAFFGYASSLNTHVIYNGVASEAEFDDRRRAVELLRSRLQPFTFVLVGRFRENKGQANAIRAFARVVQRHPEIRLILVGGAGQTGDQSYFEHCHSQVRQLALADRVEFWGYIEDPVRAFLAADVALMCSPNEAMGRVTVEAMSACRPVIGYDSGGTSELIEPERTGLLYRGEIDDLAMCMAHYAADPEITLLHGNAAWHSARERHTTETYARQVYNVIRSVLRDRKQAGRKA